VEKKKLLVTGASGFLGSHICDEAHDAGYEVHALIRKTSSQRWLKKEWIKIYTCNLNDAHLIAPLLSQMYAVIHNAGVTSARSEQEFYEVNVEASQLLAAESAKAGVKRFIFVSSQAAGGPNNSPTPKLETDPDCPISAYGRSKKNAEERLFKFREKIHIANLRYPAIYGPRNTEMLRVFRMLSGSFQIIMGMKPIYTSMIYVKDAARAAIAALEADYPSGSVYYITDGLNYTLQYIYDIISEVLHHRGIRISLPFWIVELAAWFESKFSKKPSSFNPEKVKEFKARFWVASPRKAMDELAWAPKVLAREGFAETVKWYRIKRWI